MLRNVVDLLLLLMFPELIPVLYSFGFPAAATVNGAAKANLLPRYGYTMYSICCCLILAANLLRLLVVELDDRCGFVDVARAEESAELLGEPREIAAVASHL